MSDTVEELTEQFRKIGVPDPGGYASSQLKNGFPLIQTARLIYTFWQSVVRHDRPSWVDDVRSGFDKYEKMKVGAGEVWFPHAPVIDRMLKAGVSIEDITTLARQMQITTIQSICAFFDDCMQAPPEAQGSNLCVFDANEENEPVARIEALGEFVEMFDHEQEARRAAKRPPAAG